MSCQGQGEQVIVKRMPAAGAPDCGKEIETGPW